MVSKRRRSRLTLVALVANIATIISSLFVLAAIIFAILGRTVFPDWMLPVGFVVVVVGVIAYGVERQTHAASEEVSADLLRLERTFWKAGHTEFTSEHVARHQQPVISTSSFAHKERKTPSGADLVASERMMQSLLDLVVAPFGSIAQIRADASTLEDDRRRISLALGTEVPFTDTGEKLEVGIVHPSSFDALNSASNIMVLSQARLWQEEDPQHRLLVCGPQFRPDHFDPWDTNSLNRLTVYLPQLGSAPSIEQVASQTSLLLSERKNLESVAVFCHDNDREPITKAYSRRGLLTTTGYRFEAPEPERFTAVRALVRKRFFELNSPRLTSPLTFDVGQSVDSSLSSLMEAFFEQTQDEVVSALRNVDEIQTVEHYTYSPEWHRIEVGLTSWRTSKALRQDLLWSIFQSFAAFYRSDGDWKRAGSPSISLEVDDTTSSRSGQFMEYLAVARQTRGILQLS